MPQFQAFEPQVEVDGASILLLVDAMEMFRRLADSILQKNGIHEVNAAKWYPQQAYLNAYREIYEQIGERTMKTIGKQVPEKALWPPDLDSIEGALASIDVAYHMNHRGGEIGYYRYENTGENSAKMVCYNPYPCVFDMGLIEATGNKFASPGKRVRLTHDTPDACRAKGGDVCTYSVSW